MTETLVSKKTLPMLHSGSIVFQTVVHVEPAAGKSYDYWSTEKINLDASDLRTWMMLSLRPDATFDEILETMFTEEIAERFADRETAEKSLDNALAMLAHYDLITVETLRKNDLVRGSFVKKFVADYEAAEAEKVKRMATIAKAKVKGMK